MRCSFHSIQSGGETRKDRSGRSGIEFSELEASLTPIGRRLQPPEIVPMAILLASDESAAITGQAFNICGGMVMS